MEALSLRDKVFQICSLLYEQQNRAGFILSKLESKVRILRREFTRQVLKKNYWDSEESVNKLFNTGMGTNVNNILTRFQKRKFTQNLTADFEDKIKLVMDDNTSKEKPDAQGGQMRTIARRRAGGNPT